MTRKTQLKARIAELIGKGDSIALLKNIRIFTPDTEYPMNMRPFIICELYRDGRGVPYVSDGINRRSVAELSEVACKHIVFNL